VRVVLTGGTGFVGTALVRRLSSRGDDVVVLSRHAGPRTVAWTPGQRGDWERALRGTDAVINLAGAGLFDQRWTDARMKEIRRSRIELTRTLAQAMADGCPEAALISASAVGLYGMRKDDAVLDETDAHGNDVLASICVAWEAAADPARERGLRVAHPRFGIVLGRGGGALETMLPAFRAFVGGPIGDGRQWVSWVHLHDAAAALLFLVDQPSCSGPFNVTAPHPVTMNQLARAIGRAMHRPTLFRVPGAALKLVMGEGRADALLTGQRATPAALERAGFSFRYPAIDGALSEILR
jgi:uncharacterized protein (TIGR01777 family)